MADPVRLQILLSQGDYRRLCEAAGDEECKPRVLAEMMVKDALDVRDHILATMAERDDHPEGPERERHHEPKEWVDGAQWYSHDPVTGKRIEPAFDGSLSGVIERVVREHSPGGVTRRTILARCCERGYRYADAEATLVNLLGSGYLNVVEEDSYNHERDLIALGDKPPVYDPKRGAYRKRQFPPVPDPPPMPERKAGFGFGPGEGR